MCKEKNELSNFKEKKIFSITEILKIGFKILKIKLEIRLWQLGIIFVIGIIYGVVFFK